MTLPRSILLVSLLVVPIGACGGVSGPELDSDLSVRLHGPASTLAGLRFVSDIVVGSWSREIEGAGDTRLPPGGLAVQVHLKDGDQVVSRFEIEEEVRGDWRYLLDIYVDAGDPRTFPGPDCHPTVWSAPVEHRPEGLAQDSIYFTWFGLPVDAVC